MIKTVCFFASSSFSFFNIAFFVGSGREGFRCLFLFFQLPNFKKGNCLDLSGREKEKQPVLVNQANQSKEVAVKEECGSCYGAESEEIKCCNTCDDVKKAYLSKGWALRDYKGISQCANEKPMMFPEEGCRLKGALQVSKIGGNFHITPGAL